MSDIKTKTCPTCNGEGWFEQNVNSEWYGIRDNPCYRCHGVGKVKELNGHSTDCACQDGCMQLFDKQWKEQCEKMVREIDKEALAILFPGEEPTDANLKAIEIVQDQMVRCGWPKDSPELRAYNMKELATAIRDALVNFENETCHD
jgi:hypothetical protein